MVVFPNAKINLGLNIVEKQPNGYHKIVSCFYPIPLTDALEVIESSTFKFTSSGIPIPGEPSGNLCVRAYELLAANYNLPPVAIHLHKHIPIGAGLGGGSADAAFMLHLLNKMFDLSLTEDQLENFAAQLGSDCPFFIKNKPILAQGTGTLFSEINISLSGYYLVLVTPHVHVSTAKAYAGVTPQQPKFKLQQVLENEPISNWQTNVVNDFENTLFVKFPELKTIKKLLVSRGALYAALTGSGSAVYGIFKKIPNLAIANHPVEVMQL